MRGLTTVRQRSPRADTSEPLITPAVAMMWPLIVWLFIGLGAIITHPVSHSVTPSPIVTAEAPTVQGQWVPLSWEISDALAEGADEPGAIPVPGDGCLMYVTEEWGVTVVCPDGSVITQDGSIIVPEPPAYEDERWQDASGLPYCTHPDDGLRPCIDAQTQEVSP